MVFGMTSGGGSDLNITVGVEQKVGKITIGGTTYDRYVKVVDCGALPNATTKAVALGITGMVGVLGLTGVAFDTNSANAVPLPMYNTANATYSVDLTITNSNVQIRTPANLSSYTSSYVTVEYYKA